MKLVIAPAALSELHDAAAFFSPPPSKQDQHLARNQLATAVTLPASPQDISSTSWACLISGGGGFCGQV